MRPNANVEIHVTTQDGRTLVGQLVSDAFAGGEPRGSFSLHIPGLNERAPSGGRMLSSEEFDAATGCRLVWGQGVDEVTTDLVVSPGDLRLARGDGWRPPKDWCPTSGAPVARGDEVKCGCGAVRRVVNGRVPRHSK